MVFDNKKLKINLDSRLFYITIFILSLFVVANTIFFAISMNPIEIIKFVDKKNSFNKIQTKLIINYSVQMGICIIFAITLSLSLYRIKVGYLFTSISILGFTAIVFIPIILNKGIDGYRSIVNIILFLLIQVSIAFIHKEIFLYRRINKTNKKFQGGVSW